MRLNLLVILLLSLALPAITRGQQSGPGESLTEKQKEGQFHFRQNCQVCHVKPMEGNSEYGPRLWGELIAGREEFVRKQIMDGGEHMPGFRYTLQPSQIDAIIDYLKTVKKPEKVKPGKGMNGDA